MEPIQSLLLTFAFIILLLLLVLQSFIIAYLTYKKGDKNDIKD
jgi:hypothetical protein